MQLAHGTLEEFTRTVDDGLHGQRGQLQAQDAVGDLQSLYAEVTSLDQSLKLVQASVRKGLRKAGLDC